MQLKSHNVTLDDLPQLANHYASTVKAGDRISLSGPMGAGKTTFVFYLMQALGVASNQTVSSPTFSVLNRYDAAGFSVFHADLYRLSNFDELVDLDILTLMEDPTTVSLVEWGGKFSELTGFFNREIDFAYDAKSPEMRLLTFRENAK